MRGIHRGPDRESIQQYQTKIAAGCTPATSHPQVGNRATPFHERIPQLGERKLCGWRARSNQTFCVILRTILPVFLVSPAPRAIRDRFRDVLGITRGQLDSFRRQQRTGTGKVVESTTLVIARIRQKSPLGKPCRPRQRSKLHLLLIVSTVELPSSSSATLHQFGTENDKAKFLSLSLCCR